MDQWDVFTSDRLEVTRGLSTAEVRAAWARGEFREDDLIRPAGSSVPWVRLGDMTALAVPEQTDGHEAPSEEDEPLSDVFALDDEEGDEKELEENAWSENDVPAAGDSIEAEPVVWESALVPISESGRFASVGSRRAEDAENALAARGSEDVRGSVEGTASAIEEAWGFDPLDEDEEVAGFTLSRDEAEKIEEIDMAPMVDVAFQLVLFFLVTATTILFKTLEVPKPSLEKASAVAAQGAPDARRTIDDLQADFIIVGIDPTGQFTIDREPVASDTAAVAERFRKARADTGRTAMLLNADAQVQHRLAVIVYDAANEVGLRIAIARPGASPLAAVPR